MWTLLWLLSLLPWPVMWGLSRGVAWLLHRVVRYRKSVIGGNLRRCFPAATEMEIRRWTGEYYRHLADLVVETLKNFSMTREEVKARIELDDNGLAGRLARDPRGGMILASHYGNFEWLLVRLDVMSQEEKILGAAVFAKISRPGIGEVMERMRSKGGLTLIPRKQALSMSLRLMKAGYKIGFIVDQSPHKGGRVLWQDLCGQPTRWMVGPAKMAIRQGGPIVLAAMERLGRSRYRLKLWEWKPEPGEAATEESLMKAYVGVLEQQILREPPFWLWSHRRWKGMEEPVAGELQEAPKSRDTM